MKSISGPLHGRQSTGFTLIEVIAAFTIMAMTFATILQILSHSTRQTIKSSERTRIALLAHTKMNEIGVLIPVEEAVLSGDFDENTTWSIQMAPYEIAYEGDFNIEFAPVELYRVDMVISWQTGQQKMASAEFTTLKAMTPDFNKFR